ncbi:MAG: hypothetical protein LBG72_04555, partial [Spirochaetaceae bacterium]|nr:hypothetical protein [Spirochaetaceae bacterium]
MKTRTGLFYALGTALLCACAFTGCKTEVNNPAPVKPQESHPALTALYFSDGNAPEESASKKRGAETPQSLLPLLDMDG